MYEKPIIFECKHCNIKEVHYAKEFDHIGKNGFNSFFWIPQNVQCKKCFNLVDIYVEGKHNG